jgi:hypothetical protein
VTTTRKFFTILASVLWFGHYVSARQWFAVALVFLGLGIDIVYGYLNRKPINKTKYVGLVIVRVDHLVVMRDEVVSSLIFSHLRNQIEQLLAGDAKR